MEAQALNQAPIHRSAVPASSPRRVTTFPRALERDRALADVVVLELENKDAFLKLLVRLREEHIPATYTESLIIEKIAINRWHQQRYASVKHYILDREAEQNQIQGRPLFTFLDEVTRMERRADRAARRNIEMLKESKRRNARGAASIKDYRGRETK